MSQNVSSYKNIFKATSLFGGVQVIQILAGLIRGKIIVLFLGATGMGISSLFTTSLNMITTVSGLGLNTSAIRDLSIASDDEDKSNLSKIVSIYKKLLIFSCIIGTLILIFGSSLLSKYSFGNKDYMFSFMLLSLMIIPTLLSQGFTTILQGCKKLEYTAKYSMWSIVIGVLVSIPFYYVWGINGIVPALIIPQWITFFIGNYYVKKLNLKPIKVDYIEIFVKGNKMIKLGFTLMISILIGQISIYFLNLYIAKTGVLSDVGYMNAALGMTTTVISMVFSAMGSDYFPRLSSVCNEPVKMNETVNRQGEILILIIVPILIFFSLLSEIAIHLLLSEDFLKINKLVRILSFGMLVKAAGYSIGSISFAKGDKKTFFLFEAVWGNFLNLFISVLGYKYMGLNGLGYSFIISSIIYIFSIAIIAKFKYAYIPSKEFIKVSIIGSLLSFLMLLNSLIMNSIFFYVIGGLFGVISLYFCYKELDKRLGLKSIMIEFKSR